jgi:hypothetical protein
LAEAHALRQSALISAQSLCVGAPSSAARVCTPEARALTAVKLRLTDVALLLQLEQARQPQLSLYQQQLQQQQEQQQQQQQQSAPKRGGGSLNNTTALLAASARGGNGNGNGGDGEMSFAPMPGRDSAPVIEYLYQMQELLDRPAISVVGASTFDAAIALASAAANLEPPLSAASSAAPAASGAAAGAAALAGAAAAGDDVPASAPGGPQSLAALGRALWLSFADQIRSGGLPLDVWRAGTPSLTSLAAAASSASASAAAAAPAGKAAPAPAKGAAAADPAAAAAAAATDPSVPALALPSPLLELSLLPPAAAQLAATAIDRMHAALLQSLRAGPTRSLNLAASIARTALEAACCWGALTPLETARCLALAQHARACDMGATGMRKREKEKMWRAILAKIFSATLVPGLQNISSHLDAFFFSLASFSLCHPFRSLYQRRQGRQCRARALGDGRLRSRRNIAELLCGRT